eukprot:Blabericola_migrator_1__10434@NODE_58_length_15904_cov_68_205342_g53_i0_p11_GENE_NODE_58_length_15904_cov_68_205342_g53_i0NODE_58_length_15904_cov_68_205342_g53_i0_p11_ORF_typecomplete_len126_score14_37TP_methylase/PF00590_20/1_4e05_NODE_58_length_15904_cov_68_205342_g53_i01273513112
MNAVGCCGLQLYRFGQTVSIPFFDGNWKPRSYIDKININLSCGLHTLVLLDIKVKEQTVENMIKGNSVFEPPRFMTVNQAVDQILYFTEDNRKRCLLFAFVYLMLQAAMRTQKHLDWLELAILTN